MSDLLYRPLNPEGQAIVVVCPVGERAHGAEMKWGDRACAIIHDTGQIVRDVVRDLLANPQVRMVVFDGECCGRGAYERFWAGETGQDWKIDAEHVDLVRRFVDLVQDDFHFRGVRPPFYPTRIRYLV